MRIFTLLIFLFLFSCTQTPSVSSEYMDNFIDYVETLSSDDFEGRAPGTPGGIKTKDFLSKKFLEFGLEGLNGSYLSDVKLTEITLKNSSTFSISHNDKKLNIIEVPLGESQSIEKSQASLLLNIYGTEAMLNRKVSILKIDAYK